MRKLFLINKNKKFSVVAVEKKKLLHLKNNLFLEKKNKLKLFPSNR